MMKSREEMLEKKLESIRAICDSYGINGVVNGIVGDPIMLVNQILARVKEEACLEKNDDDTPKNNDDADAPCARCGHERYHHQCSGYVLGLECPCPGFVEPVKDAIHGKQKHAKIAPMKHDHDAEIIKSKDAEIDKDVADLREKVIEVIHKDSEIAALKTEITRLQGELIRAAHSKPEMVLGIDGEDDAE